MDTEIFGDIGATDFLNVDVIANGFASTEGGQTVLRAGQTIDKILSNPTGNNSGGTLYYLQIQVIDSGGIEVFLQRWFMDEGAGNNVLANETGDTIVNPITLGNTEGVVWDWVVV